jgi:hypothetical protein
MAMTIRQGKFYNGDILVPLEFGNKEQIALLKRVELLRKEGEEVELEIFLVDDVELERDGEYYPFDCLCGCSIVFTNKLKKHQCSCGLKYEARTEDGLFIAYLI